MVLSGAMISCYFDAARDNPKDPESDTYTPSDLFLFHAGTKNGNIGDRSNVDSICAAARSANYPKLPSYNVRGFISFNESDSIANMPANYRIHTNRPIRGPVGTGIIANDWADLLSGDIGTNVSHSTVGVLPYAGYWWSGSDKYGNHATSCKSISTNQDWNTADGSTFGTRGYAEATDSAWITDSTMSTCDKSYYILCIGWN